jgi:hypothetical protein
MRQANKREKKQLWQREKLRIIRAHSEIRTHDLRVNLIRVYTLGTLARHHNIGAFCLRMRENHSVRLQMADLLGGCEFCHGFYE